MKTVNKVGEKRFQDDLPRESSELVGEQENDTLISEMPRPAEKRNRLSALSDNENDTEDDCMGELEEEKEFDHRSFSSSSFISPSTQSSNVNSTVGTNVSLASTSTITRSDNSEETIVLTHSVEYRDLEIGLFHFYLYIISNFFIS
jgi:hypothetical protein